MDALAIILRTVREVIEASGAPPDALQDHLSEAERRLRGRLGGNMHHISRMPHVPTKARILELSADLKPREVAERLGVTSRYVRIVLQQLRRLD